MTPQTPAPRISVIMVDGSFRESFHAVDFFCTQTLPTDDFELLWVEYYDKVQPQLAEKIAKYPNARIITLGRTDDYHPSYCFNAGIQAARADVIAIPDGDLVCEPDLLERIWEEHQTDEKLVMYLFRYEEPEELHRDEITLEHLRQVCELKGPGNFGACLSVRKKWLLEINGYDQHHAFHTGFHANGADIHTRFKNLGMHIMWHPKLKLYHPWHVFTRIGHDDYKRQEIVTQYRALNLISGAFNGIDPARNVPEPPALTRQLAEFEASREKQAQKVKTAANASLLHRVRRRVGL